MPRNDDSMKPAADGHVGSTDQLGLVAELRAVMADSGWAVVNTQTDGIVIWFSDRAEFNTERKARTWLEGHAETHRTHEVRPYRERCLAHEAADEIERLRECLKWLQERHHGGLMRAKIDEALKA